MPKVAYPNGNLIRLDTATMQEYVRGLQSLAENPESLQFLSNLENLMDDIFADGYYQGWDTKTNYCNNRECEAVEEI